MADGTSSRPNRKTGFVSALFTALSIVLVTALLAVGCGGGASKALTPRVPHSWPPAPDLALALEVKAGANADHLVDRVRTVLTAIFAEAGYKLVQEAGQARVVANVTVEATEKKKMFQTFVNGKRQITYDVHIDATFSSNTKAREMLDKTSADFVTDSEKVDEVAIEAVVAQLNGHGKLEAYAKRLVDEEEKAWKDADVDGCRESVDDKACEGVKTYMSNYPEGKYLAEGKKTVAAGEKKLAERQDDDAWKNADSATCKEAKTLDSCDGVQAYLKAYKKGRHTDDAKTVLAEADPKLAVLKKKKKAADDKQAYKDCVRECRAEYIRYAPRAYQIIVQRCIKTECAD